MKKLYYSLSDYLKDKFGEKAYKISVDAGFSCPNRDGSKGYGGCIYCNSDAYVFTKGVDIETQVLNGIKRLKEKGINKYIIYFQANSNTYGDIDLIKEKIESSLIDSGIVGIYIATRPDVVNSEKLDYLSSLSKDYDLFLELGLQSMHNKTLRFINRGHSLLDFERAYLEAKKRGIKVCVHIIFGLPNETYEMMYETVKYLSSLKIDSIKFHHLQVVKDTKLADYYNGGELILLKEDDYIELVSQSLTLLPKNVIISRLVGASNSELLISPKWPINTTSFLNKLKKFMLENNLYQGKYYKC
ncbi:MAG: TIGR01212 family radical SAM protein [Deferribacterota bacterium]|nr:TIGR01212 family radical SAM protein [Deferribacterota bacterium]